jgi:hypothetical protein
LRAARGPDHQHNEHDCEYDDHKLYDHNEHDDEYDDQHDASLPHVR